MGTSLLGETAEVVLYCLLLLIWFLVYNKSYFFVFWFYFKMCQLWFWNKKNLEKILKKYDKLKGEKCWTDSLHVRI